MTRDHCRAEWEAALGTYPAGDEPPDVVTLVVLTREIVRERDQLRAENFKLRAENACLGADVQRQLQEENSRLEHELSTYVDPEADALREENARLKEEMKSLSYLLTGGCSGTWDEIYKAASQLKEEQRKGCYRCVGKQVRCEAKLEEAEKARDSLRLANEQYQSGIAYWEAEADRLYAKLEEAEKLLEECAQYIGWAVDFVDKPADVEILKKKLRARKEG